MTRGPSWMGAFEVEHSLCPELTSKAGRRDSSVVVHPMGPAPREALVQVQSGTLCMSKARDLCLARRLAPVQE